MLTDIIYIPTTSTDPFFSFALEYYLVSAKPFPGKTIFLFWRTEPTLMLGKYQNATSEINLAYARENNIIITRRFSGGGTIYTDLGGFQYSFIAPQNKLEIDFSDFIAVIVAALNELGINAEFTGRNDILIAAKKISGNAQYKYQDYVVHHGSLLYDTNLEAVAKSTIVDNYKVQSKGIQSVRDRVTNIKDHLKENLSPLEFKELFLNSLFKQEKIFATKQIYHLKDSDLEKINEISTKFFQPWSHIFGKSPDFIIEKKGHFKGGNVSICFNVEAGKITTAKLSGDFFGSLDPKVFSKALKNCPYQYDAVKKALTSLNLEQTLYQITTTEIASMML